METTLCAYAIQTNECQEFKIESVQALDFQIEFIDLFASLLGKIQKPVIEVGFFKQPENAQLGIALIPLAINGLHFTDSQKDYSFRLQLVTSQTVKHQAYTEILNLIKIVVNVINIIAQKRGLTYSINFGITDSSTSTLLLTFKKRI